MRIVAGDKHFRELNEEINTCPDAEIELDNVCGQRYICSGLSGKKVTIHGIPGNALCCYLDGCDVEVLGNAQDATGDTMNSGTLTIHGHCGDATGYAMRGGTIFIEGNVGYRAGIHMKAYQAGSFLGEYQAGGYIIVLGLNTRDHAPVGRFPAAGMHGGKIFLRTDCDMPFDIPAQVLSHEAADAEKAEIAPFVRQFAEKFGKDADAILADRFVVLVPDSANPYRSMYVTNSRHLTRRFAPVPGGFAAAALHPATRKIKQVTQPPMRTPRETRRFPL